MIMTSRDIVAGLARIDAGGMPDDVREAVEAARGWLTALLTLSSSRAAPVDKNGPVILRALDALVRAPGLEERVVELERGKDLFGFAAEQDRHVAALEAELTALKEWAATADHVVDEQAAHLDASKVRERRLRELLAACAEESSLTTVHTLLLALKNVLNADAALDAPAPPRAPTITTVNAGAAAAAVAGVCLPACAVCGRGAARDEKIIKGSRGTLCVPCVVAALGALAAEVTRP